VLVVASVVDVVVVDELVGEDVVVVGVVVEVVDEDVAVVGVVVEVVDELSGAHMICTFLPADSIRAQAAPLNFEPSPRTRRALGAVMKARTVAWAPMWTVSLVAFTNGVSVFPRGPKVEAS